MLLLLRLKWRSYKKVSTHTVQRFAIDKVQWQTALIIPSVWGKKEICFVPPFSNEGKKAVNN